jgi:ribonuclease P/MRP protein subunit RPP1
MKFYDLCIRTGKPREAVDMAGRLGWGGIGLLVPYSTNHMRDLSDLKARLRPARGMPDVGFGIEISTDDPRKVSNIARGVRRGAELVVVRGSSQEVNRAALETPEVDMLVHHGDMAINQVLAKLAARNNVAVGFVFSGVLLSYKRTRIGMFSGMMESAKVLRKYRSPVAISSGSLSEWDMRSPSDMIAFGKLLGFSQDQAKRAMSGSILAENRKRLGNKWVMPGVEIE